MRGFDVDHVQEPPADEEGEQGVDDGVGEHTADGIFAKLRYSQPGEPAGAVTEEVVGCDGYSRDLGEQHPLRPPSPHVARTGGENGREQAPERPDPEEVAAEGVEEYAPEEAEQHGLEIPQWGNGEDDRDQGQSWREEAEGQVGYHYGVEQRCGGNDEVALLGTRLEADQVDPEVSLEVGLQKPLAIGDVLGRDRRAKLPGSRVELGWRDDPDPRREHLVRDKHNVGRMF